jgi:predicted permease
MRSFSVVARLAPGVDVAQARNKVTAIAKRLEAQYPETNRGWSAYLESWRDSLVPKGVQAILLIMLFSVGFVLLIACANVANLMLVRGAARQRELALRTAIGASRGRIVRQLLTESLLVALMGGTLGVIIAMWGTELMTSAVPIEIPWWIRIEVDGRVLAFTFAVSVSTALIFGLLPALRASRLNLVDVLKDGGRGSSEGPRGGRTRSILVAGEVAMSIVLLVGATLMIRSFLYLNRLDAGFDRSRLLTLQFTLSGDAYATARQRQAFFERAIERVEAAPGIVAAGGASTLPLSSNWTSTTVRAEGKEVAVGEESAASYDAVTPGFARAIGLPLLRGREISALEANDSTPVVVINEAVARSLWPGEDPVGRRMQLGRISSSVWFTVVGVVGNVREVYQIGGLDTKPALKVYAPYIREPFRTMSMAVRTSGDPAAAAAAVRRAVADVDPALPLFDVFTMDEHIARNVWQPKFYGQQFGVFAIIAVLLAAVGLYGVISYAAARRTHEIGVRMALGARRMDILRLVLSQGMRPTLAGVGLGLVWALLVTRTLRSQIFGVSASDPLTYVGVALLLLTVSIVATLLPARRASRTDPMVALRYE